MKPWSAIVITSLAACADGGTEVPLDGDPALFAAVQANVFRGCGGVGARTCHESEPFQGGLDLSTAGAWDALVEVEAANGAGVLVVPGNAKASFLWRKLTNELDADEGDPMPPATPFVPLKTDQLDAVKAWIEAGAPR